MDPIRNAKLTSSGMSAIMPFGNRLLTEAEKQARKDSGSKSKAEYTEDKNTFSTGGFTYIRSKLRERKLKRSIENNDSGRAANWGKFVELWLSNERPDIIGMNYTMSPNKTIAHPKYADIWCGSKDCKNNSTNAVGDLKCPYTLTSYFDFYDLWVAGKTLGFREVLINGYTDDMGQKVVHTSGYDYYIQIVSNCHIEGTNKGELIIYVPTYDELSEIMVYAANGDHGNIVPCTFISWALDGDLPYIPKESDLPNKLVFEFDIPQEDLYLLESRVQLAQKYFEHKQPITIHDAGVTVHDQI